MEIEADRAKQGLKTAVAELHDPSVPPPGCEEGEQLPLLPLEGAGVGAPEGAEKRGRGRPPGAKNMNTEQWRNFILSRHRSPLEALAQTYNLPLEQLGRHLGIQGRLTFDQAVELLKLQITAAKELAPYVHQKQPLAIDGGSGGLIQLVINNQQVTAATGKDALPQAIEILNMPIEENQLLTDSDFTESNNSQSNEMV